MADSRKRFDEIGSENAEGASGADTAIETPAASSPDETVASDAAADAAGEVSGAARERPSAEFDAARERDEYYDLLLRTRAEFDNYRKRIERGRQEWAETAAADLLKDLLPLVDDLERALSTETSDADAYRRGVELIHRQLLDLLRKRGVRPIDTVGADFDPHVHQAVVQEEAPGRRDGEIIDELRRGYMLGDRLLRPAMVKVAKA
jgi:molecular chaperone GrpE